MGEAALQGRRLAAILAADVVGYARLIGANEDGTLARVRALLAEVAQPAVAAQGGRIFKTMGDAFLAEFPSAVGAVRCAQAIQAALAGPDALRLRIGVHMGDVVPHGDDLFGEGVNIAARLEGLALPGGVALSAAVAEAVRGKLDAALEDAGEQALKNIDRPVRVWQLGGAAAERPALPLPERPSLVVLPFQNMSGDPEQEYFADGMVEDITTALSRIRWLFVIARNSAFTYKGRAVDVRQVGRELGVRYVLEGSVRKAGQRVRINAQLIEAASGAHLWAERFDGPLGNVFELQDRVTEAVAGAIEPSLQLAEIDRVRQKPTGSLDAYDLFLRAEPHRSLGPETYRARAALLDRALQLDPNFVRARSLASFYHAESEHLGCGTPADWQQAIEMARAVLLAEPEDAMALRWAAQALMLLATDLDRAHASMRKALLLNPNSGGVCSGAAWAVNYAGEAAEALTLFERAIRLSPLDQDMARFLGGAGSACLRQRRDADALDYAERSLALRRDRGVVAHRVRIGALVGLGRSDEACRAAAEFRRDIPTSARVMESWMDGLFSDKAYVRFLSGALRTAGLPE